MGIPEFPDIHLVSGHPTWPMSLLPSQYSSKQGGKTPGFHGASKVSTTRSITLHEAMQQTFPWRQYRFKQPWKTVFFLREIPIIQKSGPSLLELFWISPLLKTPPIMLTNYPALKRNPKMSGFNHEYSIWFHPHVPLPIVVVITFLHKTSFSSWTSTFYSIMPNFYI